MAAATAVPLPVEGLPDIAVGNGLSGGVESNLFARRSDGNILDLKQALAGVGVGGAGASAFGSAARTGPLQQHHAFVLDRKQTVKATAELDAAAKLRSLAGGMARRRTACVHAARLFGRAEAARAGVSVLHQTPAEARPSLLSPEMRGATTQLTQAGARAGTTAYYRSVWQAFAAVSQLSAGGGGAGAVRAFIQHDGLTATFVRVKAVVDAWPLLLAERHAFCRDHRTTSLPAAVPLLTYFYSGAFDALSAFGVYLTAVFRTAIQGVAAANAGNGAAAAAAAVALTASTAPIAGLGTARGSQSGAPAAVPISGGGGGGPHHAHSQSQSHMSGAHAAAKLKDILREVLFLIPHTNAAQHQMNLFRQRLFGTTEPIAGTHFDLTAHHHHDPLRAVFVLGKPRGVRLSSDEVITEFVRAQLYRNPLPTTPASHAQTGHHSHARDRSAAGILAAAAAATLSPPAVKPRASPKFAALNVDVRGNGGPIVGAGAGSAPLLTLGAGPSVAPVSPTNAVGSTNGSPALTAALIAASSGGAAVGVTTQGSPTNTNRTSPLKPRQRGTGTGTTGAGAGMGEAEDGDTPMALPPPGARTKQQQLAAAADPETDYRAPRPSANTRLVIQPHAPVTGPGGGGPTSDDPESPVNRLAEGGAGGTVVARLNAAAAAAKDGPPAGLPVAGAGVLLGTSPAERAQLLAQAPVNTLAGWFDLSRDNFMGLGLHQLLDAARWSLPTLPLPPLYIPGQQPLQGMAGPGGPMSTLHPHGGAHGGHGGGPLSMPLSPMNGTGGGFGSLPAITPNHAAGASATTAAAAGATGGGPASRVRSGLLTPAAATVMPIPGFASAAAAASAANAAGGGVSGAVSARDLLWLAPTTRRQNLVFTRIIQGVPLYYSIHDESYKGGELDRTWAEVLSAHTYFHQLVSNDAFEWAPEDDGQTDLQLMEAATAAGLAGLPAVAGAGTMVGGPMGVLGGTGGAGTGTGGNGTPAAGGTGARMAAHDRMIEGTMHGATALHATPGGGGGGGGGGTAGNGLPFGGGISPNRLTVQTAGGVVAAPPFSAQTPLGHEPSELPVVFPGGRAPGAEASQFIVARDDNGVVTNGPGGGSSVGGGSLGDEEGGFSFAKRLHAQRVHMHFALGVAALPHVSHRYKWIEQKEGYCASLIGRMNRLMAAESFHMAETQQQQQQKEQKEAAAAAAAAGGGGGSGAGDGEVKKAEVTVAYLSNYVLMAMRLFKHLRRGFLPHLDDAVPTTASKESVGQGDESLRIRWVETLASSFRAYFDALAGRFTAVAIGYADGQNVYPNLVVHSDLCYLLELVAPFAHMKERDVGAFQVNGLTGPGVVLPPSVVSNIQGLTTGIMMTYMTHNNPKLSLLDASSVSIQPATGVALKVSDVYCVTHVWTQDLQSLLAGLNVLKGSVLEATVRTVEQWIGPRWPGLLSGNAHITQASAMDPDVFVVAKMPAADSISPWMTRLVTDVLLPCLLRLCRLHRHSRHHIYSALVSGLMTSLFEFLGGTGPGTANGRLRVNRQGATQLENDVVYLKNWFHSNAAVARLLTQHQLHDLDLVLSDLHVLPRVDAILNLLLSPVDKEWDDTERDQLPDFERWAQISSPKHYKLWQPKPPA